MSTQSMIARIRRALEHHPARPTTVDGDTITVGDRRARIIRADGAELEWSGEEYDDDGWWPATGPHTETIAYAEDREDSAEGVATWLVQGS